MNPLQHDLLEAWICRFGLTATLGFLCFLLVLGKLFHSTFQARGLVFGYLILPPAMISGLLGFLFLLGLGSMDKQLTRDLSQALEYVKHNLVNFIFAALILGLTCARKTSQHSTLVAIATSVFHEGMPMMIYYQIVIWGQTAACLIVLEILLKFGYDIPVLLAALVPLGIESGNDIVSSLSYASAWSDTILAESESLGLLVCCISVSLLISGKPFLIARGFMNNNTKETMNFNQQTSGQAEAFERSKPSFPRVMSPTLDAKSPIYQGDKHDSDKSSNTASLGSHISLIAITVFISFAILLSLRFLEIELNLEQHVLSGTRMFQISMCVAMFAMNYLLQRTYIRFKREWFMRLCGLMLDLVVISALTISSQRRSDRTDPAAAADLIQPPPETHYLLCGVFVFICVCWNVICFIFIAKDCFPNYWYERGLIVGSDALGHSFCGLLMARTIDPAMESPLLSSYCYKLMLFFVPSCGSKNAIVLRLVTTYGPFITLLLCISILVIWVIIFETSFKSRFVANSPVQVSSMSKSQSLVNLSGPSPSIGGSKSVTTHNGRLSHRRAVSGTPVMSEYNSLLELADDSAQYDEDQYSDDGDSRVTDGLIAKSDTSPTTAAAVVSPPTNLIPLNLPHLSEPSAIASLEHIAAIWEMMPAANQTRNWTLKYSLLRDGASIHTLLATSCCYDVYNRPSSTASTVILIEDSWGYVFGGYVDSSLESKKSYYGNGESFVFTVVPSLQQYRWTGENYFFVLSSEQMLAMGGGLDGFAFQLDDELDTGVSNRSGTFHNNQLSSSEFFKTLNVEVWVLDSESLLAV